MGGKGSGRTPYATGDTCEDARALSVVGLRPTIRAVIEAGPGASWQGAIRWTRAGREVASIGVQVIAGKALAAAWLSYTTRQGEAHSYPVMIAATGQPGDGRYRLWWACPKCGRRAGVLYLPPGAARFACRACHGLTYRSTRECHSFERLLRHMGAPAAEAGLLARAWRERY